jgi:hypothetical protein
MVEAWFSKYGVLVLFLEGRILQPHERNLLSKEQEKMKALVENFKNYYT